jgi:hypothetical protein
VGSGCWALGSGVLYWVLSTAYWLLLGIAFKLIRYSCLVSKVNKSPIKIQLLR